MTTAARLTGQLQVSLPPATAFRLFTPRGEEDWAHGWHPRFPVAVPDDSAPGTVFETAAHGRATVWQVIDRDPGRYIRYARVTAGEDAGTVAVTVSPARAGSDVAVTYELTALTEDAAERLRDFAAGYPAYLRSWQDDIAAWLRSASPGRPSPGPAPA